ncbi:MAG TPA: ORF6N domain-containing protein [Chthoniobacterales bacterium]|nr:ORF6N domain-containing protein [Chthoniobacterales bacterium]
MSEQIIAVEQIAPTIRYIREQKVLLDFDLAALYGVRTKALNQAVRRNMSRFPEDFMFRLTRAATHSLRSQFVTLKQGQHLKYPPYAFTEQRGAMLSSALRSERAVKVNIAIMRAFVKLREALETNRELAKKFSDLEKRVGKHDEEIGAMIDAIRQLMAARGKTKREIGFHVRETAPRYGARRRSR